LPEPPTPLLRMSASPKDANLLATFHLDSSKVLIVDIRQPGKEVNSLVAHTGNINAGKISFKLINIVQWAPMSRSVLVSGGDDHQALIWDLSKVNSGGRNQSGVIVDPVFAFNAESEINNLYVKFY
jgi:DDB1- and CUL4-associated factor 7